MGLLDQLWDDTVAGPLPENGLGKLRKYPTFSFRQNSGKELDGAGKSYSEDQTSEPTNVTRRIMIIKPPAVSTESPPVSPAGSSTPPVSPFSGSWGVRGESNSNSRFRRRSTSDVQEKRVGAGPRSPTSPYDV